MFGTGPRIHTQSLPRYYFASQENSAGNHHLVVLLDNILADSTGVAEALVIDYKEDDIAYFFLLGFHPPQGSGNYQIIMVIARATSSIFPCLTLISIRYKRSQDQKLRRCKTK